MDSVDLRSDLIDLRSYSVGTVNALSRDIMSSCKKVNKAYLSVRNVDRLSFLLSGNDSTHKPRPTNGCRIVLGKSIR